MSNRSAPAEDVEGRPQDTHDPRPDDGPGDDASPAAEGSTGAPDVDAGAGDGGVDDEAVGDDG